MLLLNDIINKYDVMKRYDIKMYNVIEWHGITNTYKVKEVRCNKMHQIINSCDFINMYDINRCKDIKRYKEQPFLTALRLSLRGSIRKCSLQHNLYTRQSKMAISLT